jgi:hypothetical protein
MVLVRTEMSDRLRALLVLMAVALIGQDPPELARVIGLLEELKEMVAGISQPVHVPVFVGVSALTEINAVSVGPVPTGENRLERVAVIPGRLRPRS